MRKILRSSFLFLATLHQINACQITPLDASFDVHFLGVRGSYVKTTDEFREVGGDTSCVIVNLHGKIFIFDAGTGIINADNVIKRGRTKRLASTGEAVLKHDPKIDEMVIDIEPITEAHLLLSHVHNDHICGFPFFDMPWRKGSNIHIYSGTLTPPRLPEIPETTDPLASEIDHILTPKPVPYEKNGIRDFLRGFIKEPLFPFNLGRIEERLTFHDYHPGEDIIIESCPDVLIQTITLNHPNEAIAYRLTYQGKSIVYMTDHEHKPGIEFPEIDAFVSDADLLIYDSSYDDGDYEQYKGWGHSTWQEAVRMAQRTSIKNVAIFHANPGYNDTTMHDVEEKAQAIYQGAFVAKQGMIYNMDSDVRTNSRKLLRAPLSAQTNADNNSDAENIGLSSSSYKLKGNPVHCPPGKDELALISTSITGINQGGKTTTNPQHLTCEEHHVGAASKDCCTIS